MSGRCYDRISRHGLTEVYRPAKGGKRPAAHIIFVHGLFGHPQKTWTGTRKSSKTAQKGSSAPSLGSVQSLEVNEEADSKMVKDASSGLSEVFWPAAILPNAIPDVKIWTWGYDADVDGFWSSASQNTVSQHATNLLSDVADLLDTIECNLPIIFVVHSLGGLIVKAAMNMSSGARGNRFKIVVTAVHGILFLGTPHRGSGSASIGKVAYQITKAAARRPNEKLLQALERNSDTLDQINSNFLQVLEEHKNLAISSFREEKETRKFVIFSTIVVEADSARIGLAKEEINSIPANHQDMAKLLSSEDVGFKRVSAQLRRWINSLPITVADPDEEDYIDCVRSLDSSATKARLKNVAASHGETLQWLFDSTVVNFTSWLQGSDDISSSIYWIQGKPGSGKSTLMKFAMTDSRLLDLLETTEQLQYVISGFFFHDRGTMVQKSMSGMLQELLHSILLKSPTLRQFVQPTYLSLIDAQKPKLPAWDVESLQQSFEAIIKQRQVATRLCLFLDALDEHSGDNENLAILVKKLAALADGDVVKIKLCLASRPWDTFVTSFGKCPGFKIHDHTYNDIQAYTLSEFGDSFSASVENSSARDARSAKLEALATQVTEKAHGVFIWVRIVVEEITRGLRARTPFFVLEEMLAKMPEELEDLYAHTLERIEPDHAYEAYVMLQACLCALSPLSLEALVNITSQSVWGKVPEIGEESAEDMMQRVVSRSGGLLEVITSSPLVDSWLSGRFTHDAFSGGEMRITRRVEFIHQTVKEYVQNRRGNLGLKHTRSERSGFQYILSAVLRFDQRRRKEIELDVLLNVFEYARLANLDKSPESQLELFSALDYTEGPLNRGAWDGVYWWVELREINFYQKLFKYEDPISIQLSCLMLAAGLFEYLESCFVAGYPDHLYWTKFLYVALIGPKITSVQTPRRDMLNFLMRHGCSVDEPIKMQKGLGLPWGPTPLQLVIVNKGLLDQDETERVSAIACLLDHGANPNIQMTQYKYKFSLFCLCVQQESAEVIRIFGQYGGTFPPGMITPMRTLWQMISTPSKELEEVFRIMRRTYSDVDFDAYAYNTVPYVGPISELFFNGDALGAAPTMGAVVAMNFGMSQVFGAEDSATAKNLFKRRRLVIT